MLQLRSFSTFCICLSLNNYSLTCRVTLSYVLYMPEYVMIYIENSLSLILKIQTYSGIFTFYPEIFSHVLAYLEPYVTLSYPGPCHIQNPGIFRTQNIFGSLSRHTLTYLECCVTLA